MTDTFSNDGYGNKKKYSHILTEEYLNREYCVKKRSISDISRETGIHYNSISDYMSGYGIVRHKNRRPPHYMKYLRNQELKQLQKSQAILQQSMNIQ